ncbi:MAG TPA: hypothetical protein PLO37_00225 [Candidatus Hydrogenedentes bacterium]|nr:hypothetical protein [Candidatus Hydrogenedentota bacterium]HPG65238.1 hypothetical protein [Candidatus Hydrogenedentota bacterium]
MKHVKSITVARAQEEVPEDLFGLLSMIFDFVIELVQVKGKAGTPET